MTHSFFERMRVFAALIFFLIMPVKSGAAACYIKKGGDDYNEALSDNKASVLIKKVSKFRFSEGDTVNFKRSYFFKDETLRSSDVDNFTIRDYGTEINPWLMRITVIPKKFIQLSLRLSVAPI